MESVFHGKITVYIARVEEKVKSCWYSKSTYYWTSLCMKSPFDLASLCMTSRSNSLYEVTLWYRSQEKLKRRSYFFRQGRIQLLTSIFYFSFLRGLNWPRESALSYRGFNSVRQKTTYTGHPNGGQNSQHLSTILALHILYHHEVLNFMFYFIWLPSRSWCPYLRITVNSELYNQCLYNIRLYRSTYGLGFRRLS